MACTVKLTKAKACKPIQVTRHVYTHSKKHAHNEGLLLESLFARRSVSPTFLSLWMCLEFCPGKFSPPARCIWLVCACASPFHLSFRSSHSFSICLSLSHSFSLSFSFPLTRSLSVCLACACSRSHSRYVNFRATVETVRTVFPCCGWALSASFCLCYILKQYADVRISETQIGTHGKHSMTVCAFFFFIFNYGAILVLYLFFGSFAFKFA